jgi:hypothetical protein
MYKNKIQFPTSFQRMTIYNKRETLTVGRAALNLLLLEAPICYNATSEATIACTFPWTNSLPFH